MNVRARALVATVLPLGLAFGCTSASDDLTIKTEGGTLHGTLTGGARQFLGIPYAAPPVGPLRWRTPQVVQPWTTTLEANGYSNECPQTLSFAGPSDTEDCLYLNVWAPPGADHLPVMVWIHGGAFIFGSGNDKWYAGQPLAAQGVVVVTINYRLGALGFLAHPALDSDDPQFPTSGNYGLEDQRAALQWVNSNIAAFGGDPDHVTIFGESAGGFSACVHYLSSRTAGLFEAAISESGFCSTTVLAPGHALAESLGLDLGQQLGCPGSGQDALACLRAVDVDTILAATNLPPATSQTPGGPFYQAALLPDVLPNVDGYVIAAPLLDELTAGNFTPRPLLLGTNQNEGTLFHSSIYGKQVGTDADYQNALAVRFGSANVPAIIAHYPSASFATPNDALAEVSGDAFFVCPARATARGAARGGAPVFRYSFEHALENPFEAGLGVFHSSEVPFVFGNDDYPLGKIGASGAPIATAMQSEWTSFAKTLTPGGDWPAYDPASDPYERFDDPSGPAAGLKSASCDFWDALPPP